MQVAEPVATACNPHAAHQISQRDGQEVVEKEASPPQPRGGDTVFSGDQNGGGNVKHVRHTVFKSAEDKQGDGQVKACNFSRSGLGPQGHPDGDADEDIAQDL